MRIKALRMLPAAACIFSLLMAPAAQAEGEGIDYSDDAREEIRLQNEGFAEDRASGKEISLNTVSANLALAKRVLESLERNTDILSGNCTIDELPGNVDHFVSEWRERMMFHVVDSLERGSELKYNTNKEKEEILSACKRFDAFWPRVIEWYRLYSLHWYQQEYKEYCSKILALDAWFDDKGEDYLKEISLIDHHFSNAFTIYKTMGNTKKKNWTYKDTFEVCGLRDYFTLEGDRLIPRGKAVFIYDLDNHTKSLREDLRYYQIAFDNMKKFLDNDGLFPLSEIQDMAHEEKNPEFYKGFDDIVEAMIWHYRLAEKVQEEYGKILNELNSGNGLGLLVEGKAYKNLHCMEEYSANNSLGAEIRATLAFRAVHSRILHNR